MLHINNERNKMKIQSKSNCSFNALMLEMKPMSKEQKAIIKHVRNTVLDYKAAVNVLEQVYSDIYISPNSDGKSVDLKLLRAAGLTYNYIPTDNNGKKLKINIHVPNQTFNMPERLKNNIRIRTNKFMQNCLNNISAIKNNPENMKKEENLEYTSFSDMLSNKISNPKNIPMSYNLYGTPVVTRKSDVLSYLA